MSLAIRNFLGAHRVYDISAGASLGGDVFSPHWIPMTQGQPATVKVASIPGVADAFAKLFVSDDPFADESVFADATNPILHLTPSGKPWREGEPITSPRAVYIVGPSMTGLKLALMSAYEPLGDIAACLCASGRIQGMGGNRPYACMVPMASMNSSAGGGGGTNYMPVAEDEDYDAGDLYIAFIEPSYSTGQIGVLGEDGLGNFSGLQTYFGTSTRFVTPTLGSYMTGLGYSLVDSYSPGVSQYRLLANNPGFIDYDVNLAAPHIARYRKFKLVVYYPNEAIQGDGGFSATWSSLLNAHNPGGHTFSPYTVGDLSSIAAQIIADAVTFFSA